MGRKRISTVKKASLSLDLKESKLNNKLLMKSNALQQYEGPNTSGISEENRKIEKNAFKLLMESTKKSIGGNSPVKEKILNTNNDTEKFEKKTLNAKRHLLLCETALAKSSLNNKEIHEQYDEFVNDDIEKHAHKLKNMLTKNNDKPKCSNALKNTDYERDKLQKCIKQQTQVLNVIDKFSENNITLRAETNTKLQELSRDGQDVGHKSSPSVKKKENMLSYFTKIDKELSPTIINDVAPVIKVKLKSKCKEKIKMNDDYNDKKVVNCRTTTMNNDTMKQITIKATSTESKSRKRKRNNHTFNQVIMDQRPRRNVKKPEKYIDEIQLSTSDEELYSPKTKVSKKLVKAKPVNTIYIKTEKKSSQQTEQRKAKAQDTENSKITKLAPIFSAKSQVDTEAFTTKQKFLHSGVPDKLKKIVATKEEKISGLANFSRVVHVQQNDCHTFSHFDKPFLPIEYDRSSDEELDVTKKAELAFSLQSNIHNVFDYDCQIPKLDVKFLLKSMKESYPKFPIYRTYRLLKDRCEGIFNDYVYSKLDNSTEVINDLLDNLKYENPNTMLWTDKYRALTSNQIIGNFDNVKELKNWLINWTEFKLSLRVKKDYSDSSDFCLSDEDSRDSEKSMNNLLIITGPVGCGKTSSVYAVAAELAIKVIEVNASNKRTGKIMLQDLQEATQSHKVNRNGTNINDPIKKSQEFQMTDKLLTKKKKLKKTTDSSKKAVKKLKNIDNKNKSCSQESNRTQTSLILIDDADVVFDQDDGFTSAVTQLTHSSKRPVILITATLSCPHLQKFFQFGKVIHMHHVEPRLLGPWLDIMCLADVGVCNPGMGTKIMAFHKGDIRKTINSLQYFMCSSKKGMVSCTENNEDNRLYIEDDSTCMSWAERHYLEEDSHPINSGTNNFSSDEIMFKYFNERFSISNDIKYLYAKIPHILSYNDDQKKDCRKKKTQDLEFIANIVNRFSVVDFLDSKTINSRGNIAMNPWYVSAADGISENENFDHYRKSRQTTDDMCNTLLKGPVLETSSINKLNKDSYDIFGPGMTLDREGGKKVSRHHKLSSYLNPSATLDRRALALDYWSSCRNFCALEKNRTDNNSKRNNRFCHYLKSIKVMLTTDTFQKLASSLDRNKL